MFISDWVVFNTMIVASIDDSLTHPLHPIWDIRLQQTFTIQTCPMLWPDCFAPCKTHLFQLFHHCPLPGGFWPASFPSSRWGPSHGNFGYSVFGRPQYMYVTEPTQSAIFDLKGHIHTVCLLMQFHITNLVGPIDITDLTETAVVKDVNLSHIPFRYSPALGSIQKDGLNVVVVKPDLGFEAVLLRLRDVTESAEGTSAYVKACLDVFIGTIVVTYEVSKICEVFNALQQFSIDCDRVCCWRIDKQHPGLFLDDVQTSLLCEIA